METKAEKAYGKPDTLREIRYRAKILRIKKLRKQRNPGRGEIETAVDKFLKSGGKITNLGPLEIKYPGEHHSNQGTENLKR